MLQNFRDTLYICSRAHTCIGDLTCFRGPLYLIQGPLTQHQGPLTCIEGP